MGVDFTGLFAALASAETDGRLLGMIRTIAENALEGGIDKKRVTAILDAIDDGLAGGTYLAVSPQFVVTARV